MSIVCYKIENPFFEEDAKPRVEPSLLSIVLKVIFKLLLVVVAVISIMVILALILWFFLNPRGWPSLLLIGLAANSIFAIFVLIILYFKRKRAVEEEWIWVAIQKTIMENNKESTLEVIQEIQRKDIKIIEEVLKLEVTELVEVVVTTYFYEKYIDYVLEEKIAEMKRDYRSVIKTSEENESAKKDTMEIEFTHIELSPVFRRIKMKEDELEEVRINLEPRYKRKATVRETKEERRRKIKQILKTKNFDLIKEFFLKRFRYI